MGKISKNARVSGGKRVQQESRNMVKVIKAFKSSKSGAYSFKEKIVHKDEVKDFLSDK
ncbi:MAG: DUF4295 domain-containing protein [Chitinophagales bacterium]|nr:DUF4295 domain-containing protein [Chitinophagales bacterium]